MGTVVDLFVRDDRRRLGVASMLWTLAHEIAEANGWLAPKHSNHRTVDGDAWARAIGGNLPERQGFTDYEKFRKRPEDGDSS